MNMRKKPYLFRRSEARRFPENLRMNAGSILVIAVWVLMFFSILSVGLYKIVSSQIKVTRAIQERSICPYLARAACLYERAASFGGLSDNSTLFGQKNKREKELGQGKFIFTLADEESKININTCSKEILASLPESDEDLAEKIIQIKTKLGGKYQAPEELLLIDEISGEKFNRWKGLITVYSNGKININTVSAEVMKVLGFDQSLIGSIIDFRAGSDGVEATKDDAKFASVAELIAMPGISQTQVTQILKVQDLLETSSANFCLFIETRILDKQALNYRVITDWQKIYRWIEE